MTFAFSRTLAAILGASVTNAYREVRAGMARDHRFCIGGCYRHPQVRQTIISPGVLAALLMFSAATLTACAPKWRFTGPLPEAIHEFELRLGGKPPGNDLTVEPGTDLPVDVIVTDDTGKTYSASSGTLDTRLLRFAVRGGAIRTNAVATREFPLGALLFRGRDNPDEVGSAYEIEVRYGPAEHGAAKAWRFVFTVDWESIQGPKPNRVAMLRGEIPEAIHRKDGIEAIPPDQPVTLRVAATDIAGRSFSTDSTASRIPWERLLVNVAPRGSVKDGVIVLPATGKEAEVRIEYPGSDATTIVRVLADPLLVKGPSKQDLVSFRAATVDERLIPGARTPLVIVAADKHGYFYSPPGSWKIGKDRTTAEHRWPALPVERLRFVSETLSFDPATREIELTSSYRKLASGAAATATVWMEGRRDLASQIAVRPDLVAALRLRVDEKGVFVARGRSGETGGYGAAGRSGGFGSGVGGGNGRPGGRGGNGSPGPSITAYAVRAASIDRSSRFVVVLVKTGGADHLFLREENSEPFSISSIGGAGGAGGHGGLGGAGGVGRVGNPGGTGGDGGQGGPGGSGGNGAPGGQVMLVLEDAQLETYVLAESIAGNAGPGGEGGRGGNGGAGGLGTPIARQVQIGTVTSTIMDTAPQGEPGSLGSDGVQGRDGSSGGDGRATLTVDRGRAVSAVRSALGDLREMLLLGDEAGWGSERLTDGARSAER